MNITLCYSFNLSISLSNLFSKFKRKKFSDNFSLIYSKLEALQDLNSYDNKLTNFFIFNLELELLFSQGNHHLKFTKENSKYKDFLIIFLKKTMVTNENIKLCILQNDIIYSMYSLSIKNEKNTVMGYLIVYKPLEITEINLDLFM